MTLTRVALAAALVALAAVPAAALQDGHTQAYSQPGDVCDNGSPLYYWTLEDRFVGNESFRVFCGPAGCAGCEGGWKPVSVTMYLYWEEKNSCALTVRAELHTVDPSDPTNSHAGRLIVASETETVGPFKPAGLWAITVAMPLDAPTIEGPCLASIHFLDTCDDLPSIVAAPGACEAAVCWNDRGEGWVDLNDLDLPGNLSAYASFECQFPEREEPVAWSTIKGMYDSDDE
jgi:hypothetical protein